MHININTLQYDSSITPTNNHDNKWTLIDTNFKVQRDGLLITEEVIGLAYAGWGYNEDSQYGSQEYKDKYEEVASELKYK